jgi:hypothetical protein
METAKKSADIPEDIQNVCREFASLARKLELHAFSASFDPPFKNGWGAKVSFSWEQGRHGEESNEIKITSSFYVSTKITDKL